VGPDNPSNVSAPAEKEEKRKKKKTRPEKTNDFGAESRRVSGLRDGFSMFQIGGGGKKGGGRAVVRAARSNAVYTTLNFRRGRRERKRERHPGSWRN